MLCRDHLLDGYRLVRPLGEGGFGEVWLAVQETTGEFKALKFLAEENPRQLERELQAVIHYRTEVARVRCPHLVPIEHVNRAQGGFFYTMPLADGLHEATGPRDAAWRPRTLAAAVEERRQAPQWFGPEEIVGLLLPVVKAAETLGSLGIVHRDIKPENILFLGGQPCLGDVSLLTYDSAAVTRRGTPGYVAPSWYLESGGNPDLWGLAVTLYVLLTGNASDKLGRTAYLWPPQGERSVPKKKWQELHQIVLKATDESPEARFKEFAAFAEALRELMAPRPVKVFGLRPWPVVRDCFLMWVLTYAGGFVAGSVGGQAPGTDEFMANVATSNRVFITLGATVIGYWAKERRWWHLIVVSILLWLTSLVNVYTGYSEFYFWAMSIVVYVVLLLWAVTVSYLRDFFLFCIRWRPSRKASAP